jgi:hypothetical protein
MRYKKFLIIFLGFLIFGGIINKAEAKVNVGIVSAVKNKVKQLKDKKDKDQQKIQYKLSSNTTILSADTNSKFLGVSSDSTTYRYDSTASEIATLQPGKIMISTQGEGYLRKVISVQQVGSEYQVQTTTAALNEAFEMLNIEFHKMITPSDVNTQSIKLPKGASLKPSEVLGTWVLNLNNVMYESGNKSISISGDLSFTPTVDLIIDMPNPWTLNKFYFNVGIEQEAHFNGNADISYNPEKTLFKFPLGTYPIGPVIITPMYRFNVGAEVNISGDTGFSINEQATLSGGLGCDSNCLNTNNWSPHSNFSRSFSIGQSTLTAEAQFGLYIAPEISFKVYGVVGPYLKTKAPFVDLTINPPLNHLPWSLDVGIGAYAGVELSIDAWFIEINKQWELTLFEHSWPLASGVVFNNKPVISSFTVTPQNPGTGNSVTIQCNATDSDNDTLSYNWSATGGVLSSTTTNPVTWTAPNTAGTYTINVTVSDGYGGSVQGSTSVVVNTNHPPTITSVVANPTSVSTGAVSTITCNASDPDGDTLSYTWSATGGTISGTGSQVNWTAPSSSGTYTITCTVSDGKGGTASSSVNVTVTSGGANQSPTISSLTANPITVSTGGVSIITCTASDPDGDTLSYTWTATGGTISGSGSSVSWTAPNTPGTYTINVAVSDGYGGSVQGSTNVVVNAVSNSLQLYFPLHQGDWWQWDYNEFGNNGRYETNKGYQNGYWLFVSTEGENNDTYYSSDISTAYYIVDSEGLKISYFTDIWYSSYSYYNGVSTITDVGYSTSIASFSSPWLLLKNQITVGDVYYWNGEWVDSGYDVSYQYENGILISSHPYIYSDRYIVYSTITVLSLNASTTTPAGTFTNCLLLKEEIRDEYDFGYDTGTILVYFAPNIGKVAELAVWSDGEPDLEQLLSYHTYSGGSGPLSVKTASVFSTQSLTNNNEVTGNLSKKRRTLNRIKHLHPSFIRK